uniref:Cytochrome P450 n=1 Tax=Leptobrachium leishanense TaxID=445787 RepID=A0A8C5QNX2_9ANUR
MESIGIDELLVGLIYIVWNSMRRKHKLPPGPTPLPLIGNLLQIQRGQLVNSLLKFSKQYGSVYTLYFGPKPVICLSGYETVKEALIDKAEEFGGRGRLPTLEKVVQMYGITLSNGERWRQIRNFTFRNLRDLGFGKKRFEEKVQEEAQYVVEELKKLKGKPLDVTKLIMDAISNILFAIIFGNRYEYKDETFVRLLGIVQETFYLISSPWGQLHTIFPQIMDYIPGPHQNVTTVSEKLLSFIRERVKISQETLDKASPRHFIDSFLIKMEMEKDNPSSEFNERNLIAAIHNLFVAGTEAVTSTLNHTFLVLLYYPEVQEKLQMEIDRVIGRDRIPIINDRADMPYTDAVMNEVHRFCDLAPFSVPHMVTKDVEFRGYLIPKGTEVYPLLFSVHRDPTKFSTPYKFNPNHFLDENGKFMKNDAMMAFSAGKRICPGESLARMEFFLFLTTILQNFKLTSQTRFTEADIAPKLAGFLNTPIHYELSFIPRNGQTDRQTVMGRHWRNSQTNINSFLQLQCACLVQKEPFGSDIQVAKLKPRLDSKPSGQRLCSAQIVLSGCSAFH